MSTGETLSDYDRETILFLRRTSGVDKLARCAGVSVDVIGDALGAVPLPANVVASIRAALRLSLS